MGCEMEIEHKREYLSVRLTGDETLDGNRDATERVVKECSDHDYDRVILDVRNLAAHDGVVDDIETACYLLESAYRDHVSRLAIVHGPERDKSVAFFETYCRNRGLDIRGFRTDEDAVAWVLG
jgi:hypothetical protein